MANSYNFFVIVELNIQLTDKNKDQTYEKRIYFHFPFTDVVPYSNLKIISYLIRGYFPSVAVTIHNN